MEAESFCCCWEWLCFLLHFDAYWDQKVPARPLVRGPPNRAFSCLWHTIPYLFLENTESRQITALSTVQQQFSIASYMDKWAWEQGMPSLAGAQMQTSRLPGLGEALMLKQSSSWASVRLLLSRWLPGWVQGHLTSVIAD